MNVNLLLFIGKFTNKTNRKSDTFIIQKCSDRTPWKIKVQHDYTLTHVPTEYPDVVINGDLHCTSIALHSQSAKSLDLIILDLGIFAGIQSLKYKTAPTNAEKLVATVGQAVYGYSHRSINKQSIKLKKTMECVTKNNGGNDYELIYLIKKHQRTIGKPVKKWCVISQSRI